MESKDTEPKTLFEWRIHHPFQNIRDRVCVEVAPYRGLFSRWRFVIPAEYTGLIEWGDGLPDAVEPINTHPRCPVSGGPVSLTNGPKVQWFGGIAPLSKRRSAYLVFEGTPPNYIMFGQSDTTHGPPGSLEGISFKGHAQHQE